MTPQPKLAVPPGATDTHIHIYQESVPAVPGGPPIPGHFPVDKYREIQQRLGLQRVIVVQPNAYQDDNRVTLEAVRALGPGAKGVAVVKWGVSDAEVERLTEGGIVGQRIFQLPWGAVGFERMHEVMARVHPFGWFANVQLDGRELPQWEDTIKRLPGKFVIDHIGKFLEPVAVDSEPFKALLRMLWASNWPHPSVPKDRMPDDADLLDLLLDWAPDEATRKKILVDNPVALYGF